MASFISVAGVVREYVNVGTPTYEKDNGNRFPMPLNAGLDSNDNVVPMRVDANGAAKTIATSNAPIVIRDVFESFTPGLKWNQDKASGDIIQVDGNAVSSSYLVISKDPLAQGTVTTITSVATFTTPTEAHLGIHTSQKAVGTEMATEFVSTETPLSPFTDLEISSISQTTTTLTVNTVNPHGLVPGKRIGVYGVSDSRFNYSSLVVASIPNPNTFTATAGPMGTITSITAGPFTSGFVYFRPSLGYAPNGTSMVHEGSNTTSASFYSRANAGDALPSGTLIGSHVSSVATSASAQTVVADYTYAFQPTSETRFVMSDDHIQWSDTTVDSIASPTSRYKKTLVTPDPSKIYNLRFRAVNNKALTVPSAQIVSVSKTGSTTATVITDVPHGLVVGSYVNSYGVRDATNFANLATATAVASIVNANTFTLTWGSSTTATSYGGYVSKVNGSQTQQGALTMAIQTAARTSNVVTLVGTATWSGAVVGDYINVVGARELGTGVSLGIDGPYRIRKIATTTLELEPIGDNLGGSDFVTTSAGGGVIKRTDLRITFVKAMDYIRNRVEFLPRPASDTSNAMPVSVNNTVTATISSGTITSSQSAIPGIIADVASAAITTTTTVAAITPTFGATYKIAIPVTAVSGTNPTLDFSVEESSDSGTNWYKVYDFPRITATGFYQSPTIPLTGNRVRYVQTITGTSPSFTRAVNRLQSSWVSADRVRQLIDRTIVLTTLNSVSPPLLADGTNNIQLVLSLGAATTPPSIQVQGSDDGVNYYDIGTPLIGVANSVVQTTLVNYQVKYARAKVSSAGTTVTPGYVLVKGF